MAIRFRKDLSTLRHDLAAGGFSLAYVEAICGACGRNVDLHLRNGVVVAWDELTQSIWAEGPAQSRQRVERFLRAIYEGAWYTRAWARCRQRLAHSAIPPSLRASNIPSLLR
jgi:hypothetical protein